MAESTLALSPSPRRPASQGNFGRALLVGALIEAGLIAGLLWLGSQKSPPPPPKPKPIAVHMVQPPPPKPVPKPKPKPKPVPKPVPVPPPPRPIPPPPVPKPVVKPLVAKTPVPAAPVIASPPPPPPPQPSLSAQESALANYAALVRARVQAEAHVPEAVRLMHLSGTAEVAFELTPSGRLLWARLSQSSGVSSINRAALTTVREASYPPFSKNMPKHHTVFDVTVHLSANSG